MSTHSNLREALQKAMLENLGMEIVKELGGTEYPQLEEWTSTGNDKVFGPALATLVIVTESADDTLSIYEVGADVGEVAHILIYENGSDEPDIWELASLDGA